MKCEYHRQETHAYGLQLMREGVLSRLTWGPVSIAAG